MFSLSDPMPQSLGYPLLPFRFLLASLLAVTASGVAASQVTSGILPVPRANWAIILWTGLGTFLAITIVGEFWNWRTRNQELKVCHTSKSPEIDGMKSWIVFGLKTAASQPLGQSASSCTLETLRDQSQSWIRMYLGIGLGIPALALIVPNLFAVLLSIDPSVGKLSTGFEVAIPLIGGVLVQLGLLVFWWHMRSRWTKTLQDWVLYCEATQNQKSKIPPSREGDSSAQRKPPSQKDSLDEEPFQNLPADLSENANPSSARRSEISPETVPDLPEENPTADAPEENKRPTLDLTFRKPVRRRD